MAERSSCPRIAARGLVQKGDWAAACPKFEESERLDPGIGTLYHLADCYEHVGRLATAWGLFDAAQIPPVVGSMK